MVDVEKMKENTEKRFDNPRVGDRFHEMFSYWVHVIAVWDDGIAVEHYSPPCTAMLDRRLEVFDSKATFRKQFSYGSIPGYSIMYCNNSRKWIAHDSDRRKMRKRGIEMLKFWSRVNEVINSSDCPLCGCKSENSWDYKLRLDYRIKWGTIFFRFKCTKCGVKSNAVVEDFTDALRVAWNLRYAALARPVAKEMMGEAVENK